MFWIIFYVSGEQLRAQQHLLLLPLGSLRLLLPPHSINFKDNFDDNDDNNLLR